MIMKRRTAPGAFGRPSTPEQIQAHNERQRARAAERQPYMDELMRLKEAFQLTDRQLAVMVGMADSKKAAEKISNFRKYGYATEAIFAAIKSVLDKRK